MSPAAPLISLIVPAYNEERYLPRLLETVEAARAAYRTAGGDVEVVVADNASTDGTARVAVARGCRVVPVEKRRIGAARNGGARAARGEVLAFVDADFRIHPGTFLTVADRIASDRVVGGSTGCTMERWSAGIAVTYAAMVPFVWITGFDTGVVFCRRADFEAIGGYDESRPVAEDVLFLMALRRFGRRRGQRLVRARGVKAIASARKFDRFGDWHYFGMLGRIPLFLLRARSAEEYLDRYFYRPER